MINLGVGVAFESLDKGLKKDLNFLNRSLMLAKKNVENLQNSTKKIDLDGVGKDAADAFEKVNKKTKEFNKELDDTDDKVKKNKKSLASMGAGFLDTIAAVATGMVSSSGILKDTLMGKFDLNPLAKDLDAVQTQFKLIGNNKAAGVFMNNMQSGMKQFGVSASQMSEIFGSLSQYSMSTKELNESFGLTNKLVGGLKMNAADVADMFGRASNTFGLMPQQMFKAVGEANRLGTAFGMINFGQDIPGMFEQATKNAMMLGDTSKGSVLQATTAISKLAMSFKSAGMSSKEAVNASKAFSGNLAKMNLDIKKMNLGLGYNQELMNGIGKASSFAGVGFDELMADIQKNDPDKLIQKYGTKIQELQKQGMNTQAEQLRFSLGDLLGDDAFNALGNVGKMKSNLAVGNAKAAALPAGDKLIDEQVAINRASLEASQRIVESNKALIDANKDLALRTQIVSESFKQAGAYGGIADAALNGAFNGARLTELTGYSQFFGEKTLEGLGKILEVIQSYGKALAVLAGGFGIGKILSNVIGGGKKAKGAKDAGGLLGNAAKAATGAEAAAGNVFGRAAGRFMSTGAGKALGVFGKIAGPIGMIWSVVDDMIDGVKSFSNGGGIMGALGTAIFGKTNEDSSGTFMKMISQMFKFGSAGALVGGPIGAVVGALVGGIGSLLKDSFTNGFKETFADLGKTLSNGFTTVFSASTYKGIWEKVKAGWDAMLGWVSDMFTKPGETVMKTVDKLQSMLPSWLGGKNTAAVNPGKPTASLGAKSFETPDYKVPPKPLVLMNQSNASPAQNTLQSNAPVNSTPGTQPTMTAASMSSDAILKKLDELNANLNTIAASNINVNIVGDIRKFITAVATAERQNVATRGSGQAMSPAGAG